MRCPRCQAQNDDGARFCEDCGARLELACPSCGQPVVGGKKFCRACGAALELSATSAAGEPRFASPGRYTPKHLAEKILTSRSTLEGERKQVTVLFCDIADSTGLAERIGPEAMHALLNRFFDLALAEVHRYEGTVNQFLGDGFMALFGAPVAREDHARRAVLAALGISRALREHAADLAGGPGIAVRMGVNTGPVVVGKIGDNLRMDYTAVGDTTNLAARLQQLTEPGTILVSEGTSRLVKGYVRVEALAPLRVKGKAEAITAYRVVGLGTRRSWVEGREDRALSRFVGRERELAALGDFLAEAEAGRGQVVAILGEPGVGKSRLVYEFRRSLDERRVTYLEGRGLSYGSAIPYVPLQDIIRDICGITETDTPGEIGEKVRVALEQVGMNGEAGAPYLLQLLGVKEGTERLAQIGPETIKARIFETLRQMTLNGSRQRPLIFAVEDLHWVDKTSEEYFAAVVESLAGAAVLLLTTYRPGYQPPWLGKSYAAQISLRPLSAEHSLRVVQSTVERADLAGAVAQTILDKAEGNPFFLEELTRAVMEGGDLAPTLPVPDTIQGVLMARIDRLSEEPKRVLQTASVLGREFSLRVLDAVCQDCGDLELQLATLKRLEFLYERAGAAELTYVFKHALTQQVAYESLLSRHREALHEAAGHALETLYADRLEEQYERLAYHYTETRNAEKALDYLELANQKASKANALAEAKEYFTRALALLDTLPDTLLLRRRRISLLVGQVMVMLLLFQHREFRELLMLHEPMAIELGDPALLGRLYACLGHCEFFFGRFGRSLELETRASELCDTGQDFEGSAYAYTEAAWAHLFMGHYHDVVDCKDRAVERTRRRFNIRFYVWALSAVVMAYGWLGRWDDALREARTALSAAESSSDDQALSFGAMATTNALALRGDLEGARQYANLAVMKAPTLADKAWAQGSSAGAECLIGDARHGVERLAPLLASIRGGGYACDPFSLFLASGYVRTGQYERARATLEERLGTAEASDRTLELGPAHRLFGEIELATDPTPEGQRRAARHFEKSIALLQDTGAENELALTYARYGRWQKDLGRLTHAREYLTRALEIFERLGTLVEPNRVRAELGELAAE